MARTVRAALIQAHANLPKQEALDKHVAMIEEAAGKGAEIACLQKIFFGSYFCDPRGQIVAQASDAEDEVLVADLDLGMVDEVRTLWQFFRDRRPETYGELAELRP